MLKPSMQELMARVNNRYLLVNLAAQRARDITLEAEAAQEKIPEKPVKIAIDEIAAGKIVYREGPKPEPAVNMDTVISSFDSNTTNTVGNAAAAADTEAAEDIVADEDNTAADDILEDL